MTRLYVKPAVADSVVRVPERDGEPLPPEGAFVPKNQYWLTRRRHGDVVECKPPKVEKPVKASEKQGDK